MTLFPLAEYWWFYAAFLLFVALVLALDLGVFHKKTHEVTFREAATWTSIWIGLALVFNFLFYQFALWKFSTDPRLLGAVGFDLTAMARQSALEFLTGFVVEKTLAIDNIFVFAVIFSFFSIPKLYQHRVLFYGIIGALIFRLMFIALGSYLMAYHAVVIFFGLLLMVTGVKMLFTTSHAVDPEKNWMLRLLKKVFRVQPTLSGEQFFVKQNGVLYATPLFAALMMIEVSDIIFAVDSVPAIFALTKEPLIVFTSNIFAMLGLRSMYFMLAGVMDRFTYIKYGLAALLVFVGFKMAYLNERFGGKFPMSWSLAIIVTLIGLSILASWIGEIRRRSKTDGTMRLTNKEIK